MEIHNIATKIDSCQHGKDNVLDAKTIALIITSSTSIIIAMISLLSSFITIRKTHENEKNLIELKSSIERKIKKAERYDEEMLKGLDALRAIIKNIQVLKDDIQTILEAFEDSLYSKEAIDRIKESGKKLINCFEEHDTSLTKEEWTVAHNAKNKVFSINKIVTMGLKEYEWASSLTKKDRNEIIDLRRQLSEAQERLRDFRVERIEGIQYEKSSPQNSLG